jgi:hypothetical protein
MAQSATASPKIRYWTIHRSNQLPVIDYVETYNHVHGRVSGSRLSDIGVLQCPERVRRNAVR